MKLNKLKDKKIVILGFGKEGQDNFLVLRKLFPDKIIGIADKKNFPAFASRLPKIKWHLGRGYLKAPKDYDVILKSPGIPFKILRKNDLPKVTTQTEIFFDNCPGKIIGVTGTKGKSTTSYWIYQILKNGGLRARLVGNIGKPVLTFLPKAAKKDIFVYELSAHQLHGLKKSPHVAVLLNIYPEHLDYYRNFKEYARAKANIAKYQTKKDYLIYNSKDPLIKKIAARSKAKKIPIQGKYYDLDLAAAKAAAKIFRVPVPKKLKFLPHRLEHVGKFNGIDFYNDSLSTIPETAISAMDYLGDNVQTLILGGFDRGLNFKKLSRKISKSRIKTLILFPTTGKRIWQELMDIMDARHQSIEHFFVKDMKRALKLAYKYTDKNKICLMSPASPSFGLFKNYADRGDQFKKFARKLKNAKIN